MQIQMIQKLKLKLKAIKIFTPLSLKKNQPFPNL